jgi:predicted RNase H-like HicB family nuclease
MKSLDNYPRLTIRISKVMINGSKHKSDNGYGYRHFFSCDEIPECYGYGLTVSDALEKFEKLADLCIKLSP